MREERNYESTIFWVDVDKIKPNPYQPRKEFPEASLADLADSIRQYGVLQPLVVTRSEFEKENGGLGVEYELIAGERRLRASKMAGISQVPVVIRAKEVGDKYKLELAIIENLQREDLNPIDRALAFKQLAGEFGFKSSEIGRKVGKSREYVANTLRLLQLPEEILMAIRNKQLAEGHSRPLLMLKERPEEQMTLYKEILHKKLNVRESERISRQIATDRIRKRNFGSQPEVIEMQEKLAEHFGMRVSIQRKEIGGKVVIDFMNAEDLKTILGKMIQDQEAIKKASNVSAVVEQEEIERQSQINKNRESKEDELEDDVDGELYSVSNFTV